MDEYGCVCVCVHFIFLDAFLDKRKKEWIFNQEKSIN